MEILIQLKEELGRLYIAGSKNAVNDPRIKKYIDPLEKLSEKSKVFEALKVGVASLVRGTEEESFANLSKVYALVNSVLTTQSELSLTGDEVLEVKENEVVYENLLTYKELCNYMTYCYDHAYGRDDQNWYVELVEVFNKDARVYKNFDKYHTGSNRFSNLKHLIYKFNNSLAMYLIQTFEPKNTVVCLDRLEYLHNKLLDEKELFNDKVIPLAKKVIEEKHKIAIPEAIEILGQNPENLDIVLGFSKKKNDEILHSSLVSLYTMGAVEFEKIYKDFADENLKLATKVLVEILPKCNDVSQFENYVDYVLNRYLELLDAIKDKTKSGISGIDNHIFMDSANILSVLSYDKYHVYFEKFFKTKLIYNDVLWVNIEHTLKNLVANDIRYNELIYNSLNEFFEMVDSFDKNNYSNNKEKTGYLIADGIADYLKKMNKTNEKIRFFPNDNEIYYYYLIVIKNLFNAEKVEKLTLEFLQCCKDNKLMARQFKTDTYGTDVYFVCLLKNINKSIEISNKNKVEIYNQNKANRANWNNFSLDEFNTKIFDFLFNETYVFQSLIGRYSSHLYNTINKNTVRTFYKEMIDLSDDMEQQLTEKTKDFILKEIDYTYFNSSHTFSDSHSYKFANLLVFDNEKFARLFFDIMLVITKGCKDVTMFNSSFRDIVRLIRYDYINYGFVRQNYLKYKYLLEEAQYEPIRVYFEQF